MTFLSITFKAKHFFAFIKIKENKNFSYTKIIGGRRGRWEGLRKTDSLQWHPSKGQEATAQISA